MTFFRNAATRVRGVSFATQVYFLSSQALHRVNQLAVTLERHEEQGRAIAPADERKKELYDEMNRRFEALLEMIGELQSLAARQARH